MKTKVIYVCYLLSLFFNGTGIYRESFTKKEIKELSTLNTDPLTHGYVLHATHMQTSKTYSFPDNVRLTMTSVTSNVTFRTRFQKGSRR